LVPEEGVEPTRY